MEKEDFYIRKIGQRGKITIWLVDGSKIRRDLERDFTNFAEHYYFRFIPKYEFWLDKEAVPDERRFFIEHLLTEWRLMSGGMPYKEAKKIAVQKELSERQKTTHDLEKVIDKNGRPSPKKVHCQLLRKTDKRISVWLVYGRLVRSVFDIGFTEGGHDLVYDYIPKNEVWLDNDVLVKEKIYIILHELYERSLMERGFNYPETHRRASKIEWQARHNRKKLKENLALLGINE